MLKSKKFWLVLLILISLAPLFDLLQPGLPITHDGQDHVARIANFYQSVSEGNLVPRWAGNLNWGYGHPILMFLYPLPSYLASFFHFLGFSLVNSLKLVFAFSFTASGYFMYLWVREMWGEKAGVAAGLVYMFAPYRFVDLYVRGAIGECLAFVWPPLICWFGLKLSRKLKWRYLAGGSLALAALVLSHNALALMFLPLVLGYLGYLGYLAKKRLPLAIGYLLLVILGFALAAFFWFPAFFEGKYTLRDIVTRNNVVGFEALPRLIWSPWNYGGSGSFSVQLGVVQWLMVLLAPLLIWRFRQKKDRYWFFLSFLFMVFLVSIFMILPFSKPVFALIPMVNKFQFAWRFLSLSILPPAVFAGAFISVINKKHVTFFLLFFGLLTLLLNGDYGHAKGFSHHPESYYTGVYAGTTDTGESAPRWSVRFMEQFPSSPMEVIDGEAEVQILKRSFNRHTYQVVTKKASRLVENSLYFPGWEVFVDGQPVLIEFQDQNYRGLMTFQVPEGKHHVTVRFGETKLRMFANLVSLSGLVILLGIGIIGKWLAAVW